MAIRKTSGKKPAARKPAKPSVRKPAKASVRKPARPAARKTVARKAPVRKASARPASAGVRRTTLPTSRPATQRPLTPAPRPTPTPTTPTSAPQGDSVSGIGGSHGSQQPSFYHQVEQPMATHTVKEGETLSHIALRYYGNASEKYYMHIYNANRGVIGDNPNLIKVGQDLTIPKPPAE
jgi:nucleoid-associated protein YgaU